MDGAISFKRVKRTKRTVKNAQPAPPTFILMERSVEVCAPPRHHDYGDTLYMMCDLQNHPPHRVSLHTTPFSPKTMSEINAVELATRLVDLRKAKKSAEAADLFVTDATVMEAPGMLGSSTYKGKAKILKKWQEQDKDNMKVISEEPFRLVKPGVATRKIKAEVLIMKIEAQHTITFNSAGKITHMVVKKL